MLERYMTLLVVVILLVATYSCVSWKYKECRSVGHSKLYCIDQAAQGK